MSLLIRNARVVSMDPSLGDLPRGDIYIVNDRIVEVGSNLPVPNTEVFDAKGMVAIPGLINAHIHTWQTALRGIGVDWTSADYMSRIHSGAATRFEPKDNYASTLFGALSQISGGTTTIFDWCHNLRSPEMTEASLDALEESGIRAVFGHGTAKPPERAGEPPYWDVPQPQAEVRRLRTGRLASDDRLVSLALCILGPDWGTYDVTRKDILLAREFGLMTSAHTWGRSGARRCPDGMWRLAGEGLLGPDHNLSHGNYLDGDELRMVLNAGCTVTATPFTEMLNADRPAVMGRVEALGQTVSLGSDLAPHFSGSMLMVARHAFQHQREQDNRELSAKGHWPAKHHATTGRQALRWATEGGAKALGMWNRIGSLSPGKQADIVLVRTDAPHMYPAAEDDPADAVLMYAEHADIEAVIVNGTFVKRDGRLAYSPVHLAGLKSQLAESRRRILGIDGAIQH